MRKGYAAAPRRLRIAPLSLVHQRAVHSIAQQAAFRRSFSLNLAADVRRWLASGPDREVSYRESYVCSVERPHSARLRPTHRSRRGETAVVCEPTDTDTESLVSVASNNMSATAMIPTSSRIRQVKNEGMMTMGDLSSRLHC